MSRLVRIALSTRALATIAAPALDRVHTQTAVPALPIRLVRIHFL